MQYPLIIEEHFEKASTIYPYFQRIQSTNFQIAFPENPYCQFDISLPSNYPFSAPSVTCDGEIFKMAILAYWQNSFNLIHILQYLHLYSVARKEDSGAHLLPTLKRLTSPIKTATKENIDLTYARKALDRYNGVTILGNSDEILNLIPSQDEQIKFIYKREGSDQDSSSNALNETEYKEAVADLQKRFKFKEIAINDYLAEFELLNEKHNNYLHNDL